MPQNASNFVKVLSANVQTDINGRKYNRVLLEQLQGREEISDPVTGEVLTVIGPSMTVNVTGYECPYLFEEGDPNAKADYLWHAQPGQAIQGCIVRAQVEPYTIGERTVNTATVFVQGDPNASDFALRKQQAFDRSGRTVVSNGDTPANKETRIIVPTSESSFIV